MTVTALPTRRLIPTAHTSALAFAPAPAPAPAPAATTVSVTVDITLDAGAEADGLLRLVRELVDRGAGSVTVTRGRPATQAHAPAPASAPRQGWPRAPRDTEEQPPSAVDAVWIDANARQVRVGDREVVLTRLEFDLLLFFARHPRRVFTRDHLLRSVWGYEMAGPRTVDVHIRRLRGKLGETLPLVTTVYGVGYRLADEAHVTVVGDAA